jgi:lipopolysaccharide export system protein LptA
MYKVVAENDVRVMQGGRTISAARADAWLRLIDGRLSPGAIALASPPAARTRVVNRRDADLTSAEPRSFITTLASLALAIASPDADSSQPPATATGTTPTHPTHPTPPTPPTPLPPVGPSDTVLTWSGPLEAVPLALAPRELSSNDVYVRFVASPVARVVFADQGAGLEGDADSVEYGATRRQIAIAGPSDAPGRTRVASAGTLTAQRFELDMTAGHARVPGQGTLVAAGKADDDATSLDQAHLTRTGATIFWDQEAAMDFLIADGRDLQPVAAWASGKVVATDGKKGLIRASRMSTKFAEPPPPQAAQQSPRVTLVSALGSVEATDGAGGSLRGDHLDLTLDRVADADVPVLLSVRGAAAAERDGESIQASELTIDLAQDADGNTQVAGITAKTGVQVVAKDGASASGDELTAVTTDQRVEIRGAPAQVGRDATQISGPFIRLEGVARRITVLGGGLFTHEADAASTEGTNSGRAGRASATWTRSMAYDDIAGIAVFRGGVEANWSGPLARDRASGDEIVLTLEPAPPERDPSPSTRPDGSNRRVLTATVTASTTGAVATPALLESRRYAPRSPDTLERLLYLEGASIIANNTTGLLDVPSRGKLLVTDRRDDTGSSPRAQSQPATVFASTSTGDTLFTWDGSLALDRGAGVLTMDSGVRMSREDAAGGMTELECRRLVAEFLDQTQADPSQAQTPGALARPFSPALRSVVASGSAWMRSGGREIAAQSLSYNASTQVVVAQAPPQSTVILLDPAQSAGPVRAQGLTWDLRNNRVDATGLQTIVAPR